MTPARWDGDDLVLPVRVQPRASRDEISGWQGEHLKIRLAAAPVDGKANQALIRFLAKAFGSRQADIELLSGDNSREKRVKICNPSRFPAGFEPPPR